MRKKNPATGNKSWWLKAKDNHLVRFFLFACFGIVLYGLMMGNIAPEVVEVSIGSRAEQDIVSPVTIIDEEATERARERAAREVSPVYTQDNSITDNQIRNLDRTFAQIKEIVSSELALDEKETQLREVIPYELPEEAYQLFLNYPVNEIETLGAITKSIVHEIMYAGVEEQGSSLQQALQKVNESLILSSLNSSERLVAREMARASIIPNYVFNQEETERLRQEARDRVRDVEIREGDILVYEGEFITSETYRKLGLVGLLSETANIYPYFGLALLIILFLAFLGFFISTSSLDIRKNNIQLFMYLLIFILNTVLIKIVSIGQTLQYTGLGFVAPVAFATMLITMLIHQRLAIFSSFLFGVIAAILLNAESTQNFDITYGLVTMFSCAAGAFFLGNATRKRNILQAGFVVSAITAVAIVTATFLKNAFVGWFELSIYVAFGVLSGLLASVLTIGLMPFFEAAFGILSPMKLIELSSPNQPLLRKLLVEAPGTYHHSVMVANLAEAAAEAVGANGLLARVGAYYHDIGKTKRPHFFIENQMNMGNPHDKIAPHLSKTIITAHATDGAQMLKEAGLPKVIQDIAEQHHGTTLIKYFYHKAKELDPDVLESEFRYAGPKAQFKESAIVGIADSIEAAVRSLAKPSPERIENVVRGIIKDRLEDGQFDECDLTLKELDQIARAICETLQGIFHSRIEYPEEKDKDTVQDITEHLQKKEKKTANSKVENK